MGVLTPLFPLSLGLLSGRRSGNSSEFCDLEEVTSPAFCLHPYNGDAMTHGSPRNDPESHASEESQGHCPCSPDLWDQD